MQILHVLLQRKKLVFFRRFLGACLRQLFFQAGRRIAGRFQFIFQTLFFFFHLIEPQLAAGLLELGFCGGQFIFQARLFFFQEFNPLAARRQPQIIFADFHDNPFFFLGQFFHLFVRFLPMAVSKLRRAVFAGEVAQSRDILPYFFKYQFDIFELAFAIGLFKLNGQRFDPAADFAEAPVPGRYLDPVYLLVQFLDPLLHARPDLFQFLALRPVKNDVFLERGPLFRAFRDLRRQSAFFLQQERHIELALGLKADLEPRVQAG